MSFLVAVGISVGILAGLWTGVSTQYAAFGLVTYVGFYHGQVSMRVVEK